MSEAEQEQVTAADLADLRAGMDELRTAFQDLREASTPADRREARDDVDDAEQDLAATAKRLGVSRKTLEDSIQKAKQAERRDELRPILAELLAEAKENDTTPEPGEEKDGADDAAVPASTESAKPARSPRPRVTEPDTEPVKPHWSESRVGDLVR